ncbi:MAG: hypothetical protein A2138_00390 [Deltaproteobacteria bacterium RBG_16_71_12]|nr:MAG: hypothetical protein A2138_00390 [Deltaproteobacteria bacterium RBG_16_71_12]
MSTTFTFRDAPGFWRETLAVTGGSVAAGVAVGVIGPAALGLPVVAAAGGAALLGGSIGAALTRPKPAQRGVRAVIGVVGGALAAAGFAALSAVFGLGVAGTIVGGALGGLALGALLSAEDRKRVGSQLTGLAAAATTGAVGAFALEKIAAFSSSEAAPVSLTAATMAGVLGLWVAAASGLRRLEAVRDPLVEKSAAVLEDLAEPARAKVKDGLSTWQEIKEGISKDGQMSPETAGEAERQAKKLVESMLETAHTWKQIHSDLSSPRLTGIAEKLADFEKRIEETTDEVTKGHLLRAAQALRAQKSAIDGLKVGTGRAEAALDAQVALLERLRLAVAQHRVSDRERFAVEVSAVADQVARLSDDLESLSAAIAEAESLSDRRVLADLERAGRRALEQLGADAEVELPAKIH